MICGWDDQTSTVRASDDYDNIAHRVLTVLDLPADTPPDVTTVSRWALIRS
ncbi:hypothetical protein [Actinoplanes sp. URMC 104]|uniref:hypothetical protein n=1 Tax=Actinoplanes sp. URMC 104 TaxID=3423409 RepID=UPI003F1C77D8